MQFHKDKETIAIIDFGSQVTKLIARRVRDLGVYAEIFTPKEFEKIKKNLGILKVLYFQVAHQQSLKKIFKMCQKKYLKEKFQYLGICYGLQLIAKIFGGFKKIKPSKKRREFGRAFYLKKDLHKLQKISLIQKNWYG